MLRTRFKKEIVAELGALCVGVSFAPTELVPAGPLSPTACAVGYILSPLRGWDSDRRVGRLQTAEATTAAGASSFAYLRRADTTRHTRRVV